MKTTLQVTKRIIQYLIPSELFYIARQKMLYGRNDSGPAVIQGVFSASKKEHRIQEAEAYPDPAYHYGILRLKMNAPDTIIQGGVL